MTSYLLDVNVLSFTFVARALATFIGAAVVRDQGEDGPHAQSYRRDLSVSFQTRRGLKSVTVQEATEALHIGLEDDALSILAGSIPCMCVTAQSSHHRPPTGNRCLSRRLGDPQSGKTSYAGPGHSKICPSGIG